jgi:ribonucleotide monophosphatase NagD (HAD superfamily)
MYGYRQTDSREDGTEEGKEKDNIPPLKKVYMVGDNPESDIMGANNHSSKQGNATEWVSVLVKTGVYTDGEGERRYDFEARPELKPKIVVKDVNEAVQWGLRDMGWQGGVD